jgi:outer membrane protein assembly factor BamE (lipoprotein component of BamABCDE complex)
MFINNSHYFKSLLIFLCIILIGCQFQEPSNNHGIIYLKNRSEKLKINYSNTNDVIKIIGIPHSKSINNDNYWIYIERVLTKGEYHKLGRNIIKANNVLVLQFDKYGVLKKKEFLNKNDLKNINFSEKKTKNKLTQKSFVEKILTSIRSKMYGQK